MNSMEQNEKQHSESPHPREPFIVGFWGVRYQVKDVQRAITFYTQTLGLNLVACRKENVTDMAGWI